MVTNTEQLEQERGFAEKKNIADRFVLFLCGIFQMNEYGPLHCIEVNERNIERITHEDIHFQDEQKEWLLSIICSLLGILYEQFS